MHSHPRWIQALISEKFSCEISSSFLQLFSNVMGVAVKLPVVYRTIINKLITPRIIDQCMVNIRE